MQNSQEMLQKPKCIIFEMLLIRKKGPKFSTQSDSIRAKLFVWKVLTYYFIIYILVIHAHCDLSVYKMSELY